MRRHARTLGALAALLALPAVSQAAGISFFDDFNAEHGGVADGSTLNYNAFANWNVVRNSVDLIGNGYYDFYPGNGLYVDLDGSTSGTGQSSGKMETKTVFNFTPGQYHLAFDYGNNPNSPQTTNTAQVSVNIAGFNATVSNTGASPLAHYSGIFTVSAAMASALTVAETDNSNDQQGVIIDNVRLESVAPSIPEPAFYQMGVLLTGGGLMALRLRRKTGK